MSAMASQISGVTIIIPPAQRSCWGGILVSLRPSVRPSVCPSVRPSVPHAVSALYHLQLWMDSFHIRHKWSLRVCRAPWPLTLTYIFKVIWPWLRKSCPLCSVYSSGWILSIFGTNDHYHQKVLSRVTFFSKSGNFKFWQIFKTFRPWPWKKNLQFSMDSFHI